MSKRLSIWESELTVNYMIGQLKTQFPDVVRDHEKIWGVMYGRPGYSVELADAIKEKFNVSIPATEGGCGWCGADKDEPCNPQPTPEVPSQCHLYRPKSLINQAE